MSRSFWVFSLVFVCAVVIPHLAFAAVNTNFFGPIVPKTGFCSCPGSAPDFGCVLYVLQNVLNTAVSFGVIVMTLFIAVAGFTLMINPTNPENRSKARASLLNLVIGLAIILTAWLLLDTVMKVIYNENAGGQGVAKLGVWNKILTSDPSTECFTPKEPTNIKGLIAAEKNAVEGGVAAGSQAQGSSKLNIQAAVHTLNANTVPIPGNGYCARAVKAALQAGGVNISCSPNQYADQCGQALVQANFTSLGSTDGSPQAGDVVVIQPYGGNQPAPGKYAGHIAMWNGSSWVSDFIQADFWGGPGYRSNQPSHAFYRP